MANDHVQISELPYCKPVRQWLTKRYGRQAEEVWEKVVERYNSYLTDLPDYGGKKNGHAMAIYGALLIFALYPSLPDEPPISELSDFVRRLFMGQFIKFGKVIDLNRSFDMWLIDKVFRKSGKIHGTLIRRGTCGNSDRCDYCVVGCNNPLAKEYEIVTDEGGFLVSREKERR